MCFSGNTLTHPHLKKVSLSAGKVMATVFGDSEGILLIYFFEKCCTVTGHYYSTLLVKIHEEI